MRKHAIVTSCNARYGDFLIKHWLVSLQKNVDLHDIDVFVLDYGLSIEHLDQLKKKNIIAIPCKEKGHIVTRRFIDASNFLKNTQYDQILLVDCGDIIFQKNIAQLFQENKDMFRAVVLEQDVLFYEVFIPGNFIKEQGRKFYAFLKDKPVPNAGFILGPKEKMVLLCESIKRFVKNTNRYGPDQVVANYVLFKEGVELLDYKYNFMINNTRQRFTIINGYFYSENNELIPVVHNAGHNGFLRSISNFGYGSGYNSLNRAKYAIRRFYYGNVHFLKKPMSSLVR